jgi:hypothetical protein
LYGELSNSKTRLRFTDVGEKVKFEKQWENSGIKPLILERSEKRSEIDLPLFQAEFASKVVSVEHNGIWGKIHQCGYFF